MFLKNQSRSQFSTNLNKKGLELLFMLHNYQNYTKFEFDWLSNFYLIATKNPDSKSVCVYIIIYPILTLSPDLMFSKKSITFTVLN